LPGLVSIDIHDSSVDSPRCCDNHVALLHGHLRCDILMCDYYGCAILIAPRVHDPNVGRGRMVEKRSVEH
jgi:hypothetical protein